MSDHDDLPARLERLERLVRELEEGPESPLRARTRRLVAGVLDLHTDALRSMIEALSGSGDGRRTLDDWARDPRISAVLLLHGLHPLPLESRVRGALDALAPSLRGQGARVTEVTITAAAVHVRVERTAGHAAAPAAALRSRLEAALVGAAPDASTFEVDVPDSPAAFVPLEEVRLRPRAGGETAR